jgi:hypothetical protein
MKPRLSLPRLTDPDIYWFDLEEVGPEDVVAWAMQAF